MPFTRTFALFVCFWCCLAGGAHSQWNEVRRQSFSLETSGSEIRDMRFDATRKSEYGTPLGAVTGFSKIRFADQSFHVISTKKTMTWSIPFHREGFYDADRQIHYATDNSADGTEEMVLPITKFVTSSGQILRIEFFKRLPIGGPYFIGFNLAGGKLMAVTSPDQNYDLMITTDLTAASFRISENAILIDFPASRGGLKFSPVAKGSVGVPGKTMVHAKAHFEPDFKVHNRLTDKHLTASEALTDLLQFGSYWNGNPTGGGEWGLSAVEADILRDQRSPRLGAVRRKMLEYFGNIGYDRFEHFGMMFGWNRFPDYGAGGLLNVKRNNASWDMRMLHLNAMWIIQAAEYVLATGDRAFLESRRSRWLATNGEQPQPLCGHETATVTDHLLVAGDRRLDQKSSTAYHTLGQEFTAMASFSEVIIRLGTLSDDEPASGIIEIRSMTGGQALARNRFTLPPGTRDLRVSLHTGKQIPPGRYRVLVSDPQSGIEYFSPSIYWWTDPEAPPSHGVATSGPFSGSIHDRLKLLFEYTYQHTGPAQENLSYYPDDREYNVPDHRSGRHGLMSENSYWEAGGGGYDAFMGLWYNPACTMMAELAELTGATQEATYYHDLRRLADEAYNDKYWITAVDNGREFQRYHACLDWEGETHDYGFTYYNLEAAARDIPTATMARAMVWWLDRGQYSPDGGVTWKDDLYSIWEVAPPFNSIENHTWLNVTGYMPYLEVLTNGGTRLDIAGRDLVTRARYVSIDNMHERMTRILGRYISPDRLTGGRSVEEPGGRGRWHFGPPYNERADIEGFREIFPPNNVLPAMVPVAYLGIELEAEGLRLAPGVPSDLDAIQFDAIGYLQRLFNVRAEALREPVTATVTAATAETAEHIWTLKPESEFNKIGVQISLSGDASEAESEDESTNGLTHRIGLSITLERLSPDGTPRPVATNWQSHLEPGDWLWADADEMLDPDATYRLRLHELQGAQGRTLSVNIDHGINLIAEQTRLTVTRHPTRMPGEFILAPVGNSTPQHQVDMSANLSVVLGPGEAVRLKALAIEPRQE